MKIKFLETQMTTKKVKCVHVDVCTAQLCFFLTYISVVVQSDCTALFYSNKGQQNLNFPQYRIISVTFLKPGYEYTNM